MKGEKAGCPMRERIKRIVETVLIEREPSRQFRQDVKDERLRLLHDGSFATTLDPVAVLVRSQSLVLFIDSFSLSLFVSPSISHFLLLAVLSSRPSIQPLNFTPYRVGTCSRCCALCLPLLAFSPRF